MSGRAFAANPFFKFAWAFRLSHYGSIMIGAMPDAGAAHEVECRRHAERTARLIGLAGDHSNSGIRSFYHAIAALAWFFHPLLFMLATTCDPDPRAPRLLLALAAAHCRR